jgi:3-methyladenine DNA glycosylase AlkD
MRVSLQPACQERAGAVTIAAGVAAVPGRLAMDGRAERVHEAAADELGRALRAHADPARAVQERRYLKSELEHLGVSVPATRRCVRGWVRAHPTLGHDGLVGLVTELWDRPLPAIHERRLAAVELLEARRGLLSVADVPLLERLLREARTWALLDPLAVSVVGQLALSDRDAFDPVVRRWASDDDAWLRRASLLVHLPGIRAGTPDRDRLLALADPLLEETGFFVRKAIGWVLRELGQREPATVVAWLEPRVDRASGLTVREAVKRLPAADRERLLAARGR